MNKEDFFAQTGEALRAAMGGSMVYDPGTQSQPMDMRGIPMDAMMYAYTDAQSGQIIEGAYLWEQREGYSILYGAAYIPAEADAVLSGLVLASQTFSPVAEGAQEKVPEGGALSEWMAALYQDCMEIAQATAAFARSYQASVNNADTAYAAEMQAYAALCREKLEKVSACRSALEGMKGMVSGGEGAFQYENALEACRIAESLLAFYIGYYDSSDPLGAYQQKAAQGMYASEADSLNAMYIAMGDVKENYQALACPPAMTQTWPLYIRQIDAFQEKLYADYKAALLDDALMDFSATQLLMRQPYLMLRYEILMYAVIEQQFVNLANMLTLEDDTGEQQIWVDYSMAEEIYPNLYPSMDSAVNLALSTDAGKTRLLVEVEIEGFSQKYQRTVNVGPEITYLMIKPPAMSGPDQPGKRTRDADHAARDPNGYRRTAGRGEQNDHVAQHIRFYDAEQRVRRDRTVQPAGVAPARRGGGFGAAARGHLLAGNQRWRGLQFPARLSARLSGRYRRAIYHRTAGHGHTRCDQRYWRAL